MTETTAFGTYVQLIPISSHLLIPIHCINKESSSKPESMNNWKRQSNGELFISFIIAEHFPSLTHQKLT